MSSEKCTRCGRTLRSEDSINRGMGRTCARKARQETAARLILANYTKVQIAKALELIADGGIQLRKRKHVKVFTVVASNGVDRYLTAPMACTCPAGLRDRSCYHRASASLLLAA